MSLAAAVIGPLVGSAAKSILANNKAETPLFIDCLQIVATLRQGTDIDIIHVIEEAQALVEHVKGLDDPADLESALQEFGKLTYWGGEQ